jgi:hypothetical protein
VSTQSCELTLLIYTGSKADTALLDPDSLQDLRLTLSSDVQQIIKQYSSYVSYIRECLQENGVSAKDLSSYLMTMSAFSRSEQKPTLLSAHRHELEKADDLYTIFNLLAAEYASFLSYDIFQSILAKYQKKCNIPAGQEELMYPEHLKAYINKHRVSEFVEINPLLKRYTSTSTELVLKIDIESISTLAVLEKIKAAAAKILGLKSATLRLLNIEEGCVLVTYLIPTPIADFLFADDTVLSKQQEKQLRTMSVLRLECNGCIFLENTPTTNLMGEESVSRYE